MSGMWESILMTDEGRDILPDETHSKPSCDDCGEFQAKEWDEDKLEWICPFCFPKDDE